VHYVAKQVSRETVVKYFDRIIVRGEVVHSNNYCRSLKRNSNTVILDDDSILSVEHFFKASLESGTDDAYAIGFQLQALPTPICKHPSISLNLSHIMPVSHALGPLIAVRAKRIMRKLVFIKMLHQDTNIVCRQRNKFEDCT